MKCTNRVWRDLESYLNELRSLPIDPLANFDWSPLGIADSG
jgi:hypothetical protein